VISDPEPSPGLLVSIAQEVGLEAKLIRASWRELPKLQRVLPAILILKDGGALVLDAALTDTPSGQVVILRDPAGPPEAQIALDEARLAEIWSGEIILAKKRHIVTDEDQPFSFRWVTGQVLKEKRLFIEVAIAAVFSTFLALVPACGIMIVVDRVMVNHSTSTMTAVMLVLAIAIFFEMILNFLRRSFMDAIATRIDGRLNLYVMRKLLNLPIEYFERNPTGMILAKVVKMQTIRGFLTGQLFTTFLDMILLVVLAPVMIFVSWELSLVIFGLAGSIALTIYFFLKPLNRIFLRVSAAEVEKGVYLAETLYAHDQILGHRRTSAQRMGCKGRRCFSCTIDVRKIGKLAADPDPPPRKTHVCRAFHYWRIRVAIFAERYITGCLNGFHHARRKNRRPSYSTCKVTHRLR
jgi:subfamily B ATP-binding cassette protein HlyB/CyaB